MDALIAHAGSVLLASKYKDNAMDAASRSIVAIKSCLARIDTFSQSTMGKKITDKRRETFCDLITPVVFHTAVLAYLNNVDAPAFTTEKLAGFAEEFHIDYQVDALLCSNQMMGHVVSLMEIMFDSEAIDTAAAPQSEEDSATSLQDEALGESPSGSAAQVEESEELEEEPVLTDPTQDIEPAIEDEEESVDFFIACIFAGAMILADMFDSDFGVILYNAGTIDEF